MMMTPIQCRMARAALRWSTKKLAQEASVGFATVTRFEVGGTCTIPATIRAMQRAFENAGIRFIGGTGADAEGVSERYTSSS